MGKTIENTTNLETPKDERTELPKGTWVDFPIGFIKAPLEIMYTFDPTADTEKQSYLIGRPNSKREKQGMYAFPVLVSGGLLYELIHMISKIVSQ